MDWLSARRLKRAVDRLAGSTQPDPGAYHDALLLALRLDPPQAMELWRAYDARIPAERYAFRAEELAEFATQPDRNVLKVVFEVADRLRLDGPRRAARDRLAGLLAGDADALVFQLQHWYETGALDADLLSRVVRAHVTRVPLRRDAPQWTALFERLPAGLLPDLFDVRCLLGQGADAVRLADTPAREQEALDCCAASPRIEDVEAGLALADRRGDQEAACRLRERAGDLHAAAGRFAAALEHYARSGRTDRVSECHERLGQFAEALATCPADRPDRLADLAGRCRPELDALVERQAFDEAARAATRLLAELDRATPATAAVQARRAEVSGLRAAVLAAGGDHFSDLVRRAAPDDRSTVQREWSRFAEAAGELGEAARLAELGGDRYRAHRLFGAAGLHGDAVRVLRDDRTPEGLAARAEAAESGGDLVGAARLRSESGEHERAFELFRRAGEHALAADCLRTWLGDEAAIEDPRFADALRRAGDAAGLARLCLAAIGRRGRDTRAVEELRRLSSEGLVPNEMAAEVSAALDGVGANPRRGFEDRAQAWVARARADIGRRFADIWGLDLGTTTCAVAIFDTRLGKPVLCPWKGHDQFAATLSVDREGNELVGLAGEEIFASWLVGHISAAKRAMGMRRSYRIRERTYRPEEVAARLIQHARGLVESFLAARVRDRLAELARAELGEVHDDWLTWAEQHHDLRLDRQRAILTIPANFLNNQKQATRDACAIAGVDVVRLIHEPTAACISAARERHLTGRVVVVDLGAGTLDASYLEVEGNVYDVQQVIGDNHYGGKDFDAAITRALVERLAAQGVPVPDRGVAQRRLEAAAEYLKIALSGREQADYTLLGFAGGADVRLELSRADLAAILAEPLETLRRTCAELSASLKQRPEHLVLVGGPMLAPLVRELVEEAFELRRVPVADPRTAVAFGAALQAAVLDGKLSELLLLDVTPLALGIRIVDGTDPTKDIFSVLVEANTTIPTKRRREYSTNEDNQTAVDIEIFNAELDPASKIGQFRLDGIPPAPRGTPKIDVTFAIDASCVLEVTAEDRGSGRSKSIRVSDTTLLSPAEVEELARKHRRQEERTALRERLQSLAADASGADSEPLWREFRDRQSRYRPSGAPPDPAAQQTLAEMFARSGEVELELLLVQGPLRDLATKACEYLDRPPLDDLTLVEAQHLADALARHLDQFHALIDQVSGWNDLLIRLAIAEPDPLRRFHALHRSGRYAEALAALPSPPADPASLERYLQCLAETGDASRYRSLVPPAPVPSSDALLTVAVGSVTGTGFLVSDRLVVTNRHWLLENRSPVAAARVSVGGAPVDEVFLGSLADVAVLRLTTPSNGTPLRLGYPKLSRVGDPVWTPGADHGVIDAFETFPEEDLRLFRTGLRLPAHASGGPLLNDLGEVVGVLSINERSTGTFAFTADALDPLLAAAGFSR